MNKWGLPSRDERPHAKKTQPLKDRDVLQAFADAHPFCQCCGDGTKALHIHHMIGGRGGRSDDSTNLLRLCFHPCHDLADGLTLWEWHPGIMGYVRGAEYPKLPLAVQLTIKLLRDPDEYDADRLAALHGRALPEPMPIPDVFRILFTKNREGR